MLLKKKRHGTTSNNFTIYSYTTITSTVYNRQVTHNIVHSDYYYLF